MSDSPTDLDRREQALALEEQELDARWDAHERRWKLLLELRDYLREREATLRARATRLGVGRHEVEDALAPVLGETADGVAAVEAATSERAALTAERERLCERRRAALAHRREALARVETVYRTVEETLVLREQQLADAFRRLVTATRAEPPAAEPSPWTGRRASPRIEVNAHVDYRTQHEFYAGETANLGVGGLFIATENLLQVGREIALNLDLPEAGALSLKGEVAWRRPQGSTEGPAGLGIRFVELQEEMRSSIEAFLSKRAMEPARE